jgi:hypothetical protein
LLAIRTASHTASVPPRRDKSFAPMRLIIDLGLTIITNQ